MRILSILAIVVLLLVAFVIVGIEESGDPLTVNWITGLSIVVGSVFLVYRYGVWFGLRDRANQYIVLSLLINQCWAIAASMVCGCDGWAAITIVVACVIGLLHDTHYDTSSWPYNSTAPSGLITSIVAPLMVYARISNLIQCEIIAWLAVAASIFLAFVSFSPKTTSS